MKIEINDGNRVKQKVYLKPEMILRFLITSNDQMETLILCKSSEIDLITTDFNLYEAIASIKTDDAFKLNKLGKLFEVVDIHSFREKTNSIKPVLTDKRVDEIRKLALGGKND